MMDSATAVRLDDYRFREMCNLVHWALDSLEAADCERSRRSLANTARKYFAQITDNATRD